MRKLLVLLLAFACSVSYATGHHQNLSIKHQGNLSQGYDHLAKQCRDLQCIQGNLNMIDGQIAALVAKRLAFVRRSAAIKNSNVLLQNKPGLGTTNVGKEGAARAKFLGFDKKVGGSVFKSIHKMSDTYEKEYLKPAPD